MLDPIHIPSQGIYVSANSKLIKYLTNSIKLFSIYVIHGKDVNEP